jgi:predicted nucleotidyltransferase
MRISDYEKETIVDAVKSVDPDARIWLFGSRADDGKKGGDIDVGVLSPNVGVKEEIKIRQSICDKIGEQKIDLAVSKDGQGAFFKYVVTEGILLYG